MKGDEIFRGYMYPIDRSTLETAMNLHKTGIYKRCPMYANVPVQLAYSLAIYESRGEYKGTVESAIECLKQAEYEFESDGAK